MLNTLYHANSVLLALILTALAGIHIYWAMGGQWWLRRTVPMGADGKERMPPGKFATLFVAAALLDGVCVVIGAIDLVPRLLSVQWHIWLSWLWAVIFGARGVGGLVLGTCAASLRPTEFAYWDRRLYAPLCLYLSASFVWIALTLS